jgi:uncharacterized membrane protein
MRRGFSTAIIALSIAGLVVAGFSLAHKESFVSGAFCKLGETFNCDVVNKGPYSEILGVPVALVGILGYGCIGAAAFLHRRDPKDPGFPLFIFFGSLGGLGFSGYLTSIEAFILHTWCLLCLTSQAIMLALFVCAVVLRRETRSRPTPPASI